VAVHNHLTGLCDRARDARAKYERVKAHLKKLN
jgi:hypothetical protein